jgi:hypothetical protein
MDSRDRFRRRGRRICATNADLVRHYWVVRGSSAGATRDFEFSVSVPHDAPTVHRDRRRGGAQPFLKALTIRTSCLMTSGLSARSGFGGMFGLLPTAAPPSRIVFEICSSVTELCQLASENARIATRAWVRRLHFFERWSGPTHSGKKRKHRARADSDPSRLGCSEMCRIIGRVRTLFLAPEGLFSRDREARRRRLCRAGSPSAPRTHRIVYRAASLLAAFTSRAEGSVTSRPEGQVGIHRSAPSTRTGRRA